MESELLIYLIISFVIACIFGAITKTINENKGYEGGFAWGFWLSWIGIIIVSCKEPVRTQHKATPSQVASSDGWECKCGRYHPSYISTCPCGINRRDLISPPPPISNENIPLQQNPPAKTELSTTSKRPVSLVDETNTITALKEYKALLDSGIITQDEFDAKKKDLLTR